MRSGIISCALPCIAGCAALFGAAALLAADADQGTPATPVSQKQLESQGDELYTVEDVVDVRQWLTVQRVLQVQNASLAQPAPPSVQPPDIAPSPFQPPDIGEVSFDLDPDIFERVDPSAPVVEGVNSAQNTVLPSNDVAGLLQMSNTVQSLGVQRRSPVNLDPHIRGYSFGQVYTISDGVYWTPVRQDLDSMLSKIDPWLIQNINVIPGPYGVRYGPGFSFIDIVTFDTPRYDCFESHARLGTTVLTNGGQVNGRATAYGGNTDYGYIVNYVNRVGGDYAPGGNAPLSWVPASYHMQSFLGQFGFDLSDSSRLEIRYNRLDQTDTEFAAQIFDIDYLGTDNISASYISEDPCNCSEFRLDGWYNRTRFNGDTLRRGKRDPFFVIDRIEDALSQTRNNNGVGGGFNVSQNWTVQQGFVGYNDGDVESTGARVMKTYGDEASGVTRLGADIRYVEQHLFEIYRFFDMAGNNITPVNPLDPANPDPSIQTNLPRSNMIDPGAFAETTLPWLSYWSTTVGARMDFVHTDAQVYGDPPLNLPEGLRGNPPGSQSSLAGAPGNLPQNDVLYAFYATNDFDLTETLDMRFGVGHAQRVPTLTERYADGVFMGIIQNGFSRVIGTPDLKKERAWQMDLTFDVDHGNWRGQANLFYSWILDYVTYSANQISDPTGARLLLATNTKRASLSGFSLYGETDVNDWLGLFGSVRYVEGRDRIINSPLPQIAPLEGRLGLRIHQATDDPQWGLEFAARMVDDQPRNAFLRPVGVPATPGNLVQVEEETPGFTLFYVRGYYNVNDRLFLVGGVENLFDRTYLEHLDLRLPDSGRFVDTRVFSPGITPYAGFEWVY